MDTPTVPLKVLIVDDESLARLRLRGLVESLDAPRAEGVLEDLAQLFRVALADAGTDVSLDEEIALAQAYLAIEQVRFG